METGARLPRTALLITAPIKISSFSVMLPASWIATPPGAFCIFFPEDAHAPLVSNGEIRKVILKIAVACSGIELAIA